MALKTFKPTTPSQRQLVLVDRSHLWKGKPVKPLTEGLNKSGGRNNTGRVSIWHRGGGHKRTYRKVDFKRKKLGVSATVERLEYDPKVIADEKVDVKPGNAMPLASMPIGTIVHNVEMKQGKGGQIARAAGAYVQLVGRDSGYAILRLNSGETRMVPATCMATVGAVSNPDNANVSLSKAGRSRWKGRKPVVRGVAMNPIDHPHGGGEGRTSGGRHPVTPWGKSTKGKRTRTNKVSDKYILRSRHMKKKKG
jgi:large subunit ribosomal protein L2